MDAKIVVLHPDLTDVMLALIRSLREDCQEMFPASIVVDVELERANIDLNPFVLGAEPLMAACRYQLRPDLIIVDEAELSADPKVAVRLAGDLAARELAGQSNMAVLFIQAPAVLEALDRLN